MSDSPRLARKLRGFGTTVFAEITTLARAHDAVNLGQGFPDFEGPTELRTAATHAINSARNQYARSAGVPELVTAIADHQRDHYGLEYDAMDEVTVHSGATEAIFCALQALCNPGDGVVLLQPYYDSYRAGIAMAGGVEQVVTLNRQDESGRHIDPGFALTEERLQAAIDDRTRLILLNSPHNPTGRVLSDQELGAVAKVAVERDLIVISDEVYEHLVFTGAHRPISTLPGMRDRTVCISSAGKTFSFTGWKVGWACAPTQLSSALRSAHQFVTFSTAAPLQHGIAAGFALGSAYFDTYLADYRRRRALLCEGLRSLGLTVFEPEGTYFACVDIRPLGFGDGFDFCKRLPSEVGVAAIPCGAFYVEPGIGSHLVRFAFCKTDAMLEEGIARLRRRLPSMARNPD